MDIVGLVLDLMPAHSFYYHLMSFVKRVVVFSVENNLVHQYILKLEKKVKLSIAIKLACMCTT